MKHQYKVDIRWSDEDKAWIARVPELDGVVTHGDTVVEAARMAEDAIALYIASLQAHNEILPKPMALRQLSGKYPLRMGKDRHMDVVIRATKLGMSVNEYLTWLIDREENQENRARHLNRSGTKTKRPKKDKAG